MIKQAVEQFSCSMRPHLNSGKYHSSASVGASATDIWLRAVVLAVVRALVAPDLSTDMESTTEGREGSVGRGAGGGRQRGKFELGDCRCVFLLLV